jgi:hypothetical protein
MPVNPSDEKTEHDDDDKPYILYVLKALVLIVYLLVLGICNSYFLLADSMELLWNSVKLSFLPPFWKCNFAALVKLTALDCLQEWLPLDSTNGKHCYQCHTNGK